jgi:hypothetical protein
MDAVDVIRTPAMNHSWVPGVVRKAHSLLGVAIVA